MSCVRNMEYNDFYKMVIISEKEKRDALPYLNHRGIKEHINVATFLQGFLKKKLTYDKVATAFRYDKRIRRVLYKYIGCLEENIRSYISNKYETIDSLPPLCKDYYEKHKCTNYYDGSDTFTAISYLKFKHLIKLSFALPDGDFKKLYAFNHSSNDSANIIAINEFRNQIGHNKFLLNNRDLKRVYLLDSFFDSSLRANIINLTRFLPEGMSNSLKKDINNSSHKGKDKHPERHRTWSLIPKIVIKFKDEI